MCVCTRALLFVTPPCPYKVRALPQEKRKEEGLSIWLLVSCEYLLPKVADEDYNDGEGEEEDLQDSGSGRNGGSLALGELVQSVKLTASTQRMTVSQYKVAFVS